MPIPHIFLSYSHQCSFTAKLLPRLEETLRQAGAHPLRDQRIPLGEAWEPTLLKWLSTCHGAVVVLSPEALRSPWCQKEVQHLLHRRLAAEGSASDRFDVFPILVGGLTWEVVRQANDFAGLAAFQGQVHDEDLCHLSDAVRGLAEAVALPAGLSSGVTQRRARTPAALLLAAQQIVPFTGRQAEVQQLNAWLDTEEPISIQLVYGKGGLGKTRLALEVVRQRNLAGWDAGFLLRNATMEQMSAMVGSPVNAPLLVVVDYAETRLADVRNVLRGALELEGRTHGRPAVRILMLARGQGEWWNTFRDADPEIPDVLAVSPDPMRLAPLAASVDQHALWTHAWGAFAAHELLELTQIPPPPPLPTHDEMGLPLYLEMAALVALFEGHLGGNVDLASLLERVLGHERRYWQRALEREGVVPSDAQVYLERLLAALVLYGGGERLALEQALAHASPHLDRGLQERAVYRLYGERGVAGMVRPVEPDLLGEHLVAVVLERAPTLLAEVFDDAPQARPVTVLTRLAARTGDHRWLLRALLGRLARWWSVALAVAQESEGPLPKVLEQVFHATEPQLDASELRTLYEQLPGTQRTVALGNLALAVVEARHARGLPQAPVLRADWWGELAARRSAVGRHKEAATDMQAAVDAIRPFARARPERYERVLSGLLNDLSLMRSSLGEWKVALRVAEESAKLARQRLRAGSEDGARRQLVMSLNTLGGALGEMGRHREAVRVAREAVREARTIAAGDPQALPSLVRCLLNLGTHLSKVGESKAAIEACQEAVDQSRELADSSPDAFLPLLSLGLNNLGGDLVALGRWPEAVLALQEAVAVRRRLARVQPAVYRPLLAASLYNLGAAHAEVGDPSSALEKTQEAVSIFRSLPEGYGRALLPDYANAVGNLASDLSAINQVEAALDAFREAVGLYRDLVDGNPDAFTGALATALVNFGSELVDARQFKEAHEVVEEAVLLLRELVVSNEAAYLPDLAAALNVRGQVFSALRMPKKALLATREALEHFGGLAAANNRYKLNLATTMHNFAADLQNVGLSREAIIAADGAVARLQHLARRSNVEKELAHAHRVRGLILVALDERLDEAVSDLDTALDSLMKRPKASPDDLHRCRQSLALAQSKLETEIPSAC